MKPSVNRYFPQIFIMILLMLVAIVVTACSQRQMLMFDKNPLPADIATIRAGKKLFMRHCMKCHGEFALGDGELAQALPVTPANLTDLPLFPRGFIEFAITTGGDTEYMPQWGKVLTKQQIQQLGVYLRSIQQ